MKRLRGRAFFSVKTQMRWDTSLNDTLGILLNVRLISSRLLWSCALVAHTQRSFTYDTFTLGKNVSFNDVVNHLEDRSLMITEPSVYQVGGEIKYRDHNGVLASLNFLEGSQILKSVSLSEIHGFDLVKALQQQVFNLLEAVFKSDLWLLKTKRSGILTS